MKISQRSAPGSSAWFSHLKIAQKTMAVQSEERAYTSDSTAENQNVSEKVYASAPTSPLPMIRKIFPAFSSPDCFRTSFLARAVMVQKRNRIVNPLARTDPKLERSEERRVGK